MPSSRVAAGLLCVFALAVIAAAVPASANTQNICESASEAAKGTVTNDCIVCVPDGRGGKKPVGASCTVSEGGSNTKANCVPDPLQLPGICKVKYQTPDGAWHSVETINKPADGTSFARKIQDLESLTPAAGPASKPETTTPVPDRSLFQYDPIPEAGAHPFEQRDGTRDYLQGLIRNAQANLPNPQDISEPSKSFFQQTLERWGIVAPSGETSRLQFEGSDEPVEVSGTFIPEIPQSTGFDQADPDGDADSCDNFLCNMQKIVCAIGDWCGYVEPAKAGSQNRDSSGTSRFNLTAYAPCVSARACPIQGGPLTKYTGPDGTKIAWSVYDVHRYRQTGGKEGSPYAVAAVPESGIGATYVIPKIVLRDPFTDQQITLTDVPVAAVDVGSAIQGRDLDLSLARGARSDAQAAGWAKDQPFLEPGAIQFKAVTQSDFAAKIATSPTALASNQTPPSRAIVLASAPPDTPSESYAPSWIGSIPGFNTGPLVGVSPFGPGADTNVDGPITALPERPSSYGSYTYFPPLGLEGPLMADLRQAVVQGSLVPAPAGHSDIQYPGIERPLVNSGGGAGTIFTQTIVDVPLPRARPDSVLDSVISPSGAPLRLEPIGGGPFAGLQGGFLDPAIFPSDDGKSIRRGGFVPNYFEDLYDGAPIPAPKVVDASPPLFYDGTFGQEPDIGYYKWEADVGAKTDAPDLVRLAREAGSQPIPPELRVGVDDPKEESFVLPTVEKISPENAEAQRKQLEARRAEAPIAPAVQTASEDPPKNPIEKILSIFERRTPQLPAELTIPSPPIDEDVFSSKSGERITAEILREGLPYDVAEYQAFDADSIRRPLTNVPFTIASDLPPTSEPYKFPYTDGPWGGTLADATKNTGERLNSWAANTARDLGLDFGTPEVSKPLAVSNIYDMYGENSAPNTIDQLDKAEEAFQRLQGEQSKEAGEGEAGRQPEVSSALGTTCKTEACVGGKLGDQRTVPQARYRAVAELEEAIDKLESQKNAVVASINNCRGLKAVFCNPAQVNQRAQALKNEKANFDKIYGQFRPFLSQDERQKFDGAKSRLDTMAVSFADLQSDLTVTDTDRDGVVSKRLLYAPELVAGLAMPANAQKLNVAVKDAGTILGDLGNSVGVLRGNIERQVENTVQSRLAEQTANQSAPKTLTLASVEYPPEVQSSAAPRLPDHADFYENRLVTPIQNAPTEVSYRGAGEPVVVEDGLGNAPGNAGDASTKGAGAEYYPPEAPGAGANTKPIPDDAWQKLTLQQEGQIALGMNPPSRFLDGGFRSGVEPITITTEPVSRRDPETVAEPRIRSVTLFPDGSPPRAVPFPESPRIEETSPPSVRPEQPRTEPQIVPPVPETQTTPFTLRTACSASIVDCLEDNEIPSAFASRQKIAQQLQIANYRGTDIQNRELIKRLNTSGLPVPVPQPKDQYARAAQNYPGGSIVDFLRAGDLSSDYASRASIAEKNGIANYQGTALQNLQLLQCLRDPACRK